MGDLKNHRKGWDLAEHCRANELISLTPKEALHQFRNLFSEFAPLLNKTEEVFESERQAYLTQLQERLQRLAQWQKNFKK